MKRLLFTVILIFSLCIGAKSENIVITDPGYFSAPVRDGHVMFPDSLVFDRDAEEITIPAIGTIGPLGNYGFTNLKKVTFGDIDYLPGGLFYNCPTIEEVVFDGMIGHFDCTLIGHCPNLKKVTFRGPVSSTGGPAAFYNNPGLESVVFESVVANLGIKDTPEYNCDKLKGFTNRGAFLKVCDEGFSPSTPVEQIAGNQRLIADMERLAAWQTEVLQAEDSGWLRATAYRAAKELLAALTQLKSPKAASLEAAMKYAWDLGDNVKTKLEMLKESPDYAPDSLILEFRYEMPTDSQLTITRERFNLDSIAGSGDDVSRIMNLLYWVHNNIKHDGNNGLASGPRTLANTYDSALRDSCGYNCRALAISLAEALLAEGIPARYITCLPKDWANDDDCHVICTAWSESLGKWIWVDPTFAAFVTDENGTLLHPGEVRYRLQHDLPLALNEDANWNNLYPETREEYLDEYMAKNLYILDACTVAQAEPEGNDGATKAPFVSLVPIGVSFPHTNFNTTDEAKFWQPPY